MSEGLELAKKYYAAKETLLQARKEFEAYINSKHERIDEVIKAVCTTAYGVSEEDVEWGYYEPYQTVDPVGGLYGQETELYVDLSIPKVELYTEFIIDFKRIDEESYIKDLIVEEARHKLAVVKHQLEKDKIENKIRKLQEELENL